ncbi:uroplakin-3b-like [Pantherophis guttatus]|uniref:Uroplakin-3b-like n=1 Tax=Pantherophis guttatus TaxID=94885 RepID=A0A6P9CAE0_PANGU|nr:uroplakin-3b-like [Pantherophis guttatus]
MMMEALAVSMVLLIGITINATRAGDLVDYTPHLTSEEMEGKITASTFALQQPRCVFNKVVDPADVIWLVVALSEAVKSFKNPKTPGDLPYQSFAKNYFYMTLNTTVSNYPCPEKSDDIAILRVGSETECVVDLWRPDCNGPLPGPGPYRVRFLAINSTGVVVKESKWSDPITLIRGRNPDRIVAKPRRRRTETNVIITILSILSAILVAALIAAFIYKYSNICDKPMSADFVGIQDPTIVRYTTHQMHDRLSIK